MMQVRCQRCGWMYTLSRDSIGYAVAETEESGAEYYQENCPKCRNVIKIQVTELRKRLPADYVLPQLPPRPTPIHVVKKDEEAKAVTPPRQAAPAAAPEPQKTPTTSAKSAPQRKTTSKAKPAPKSKTGAKSKSKPKTKTAPKRKSGK